ncbi:hypothetical protein DMENIID0001_030270 [Sergentomyia squamirostris]
MSDSESDIEYPSWTQRTGRVLGRRRGGRKTSSTGMVLRSREMPKAAESDDSNMTPNNEEDDGAGSEDSQWENDWESDLERENAASHSLLGAPNNFDESSNDSTSSGEKCPICFATFKEQEIGIPNSCTHRYCGKCIEEWSKTVRTCPIDRQTFSQIIIIENIESCKTIREISVSQNPKVMAESDGEEGVVDLTDITHCEVCNHSNHEESMLLCDSCNRGYHMFCLDPPITEIPIGEWFCAVCRECTDIETLFQTRRQRRTQPTARRRAQSRRSRRQRSRRSCRTRVRSLLSHMRRSAAQANLLRSENGEGEQEGQSLWERHRAEVPRLSLFGIRNQLDFFVSEGESDSTEDVAARASGSVGVLAPSRRARTSTTVTSLHNRKAMLQNSVPIRSEPIVDLLSNILNEQEVWQNVSRRNNLKNVRINSDGTLDFSEVPEVQRKTTVEKKEEKPPEVTQAPMYPRGGGGGGGNNWNNRQSGGGQRGGGRGGGNYRNNTNYGGNYRNSNFNQFNRGNSSNFGNFRRNNNDGGIENFRSPNQIPPLFPRNNQTPRGRQQFQHQPRFQEQQSFTPNRFNPLNQNRDNVNNFSNNLMCTQTRVNTDTGFGFRNFHGHNASDSVDGDSNFETADDDDQGYTPDDNYEADNDTSCGVDTVQSRNDRPNVENSSSYQSYRNDTTENLQYLKNADVEYNSGHATNFNYSNVTPLNMPPPVHESVGNDADDCPNFSVYSAEAMQFANNVENAPNDKPIEDENVCEEQEEDLVQMDDDEEENTERNVVEEPPKNLTLYSPTETPPESPEENTTDKIPSTNTEDQQDEVGNSNVDLANIPIPELPEPDLENIPIPVEKHLEDAPKQTSGGRKDKKGVLELYDDSDWEELNLIKTDDVVVANVDAEKKEEKNDVEEKIDPADDESTQADPRSYTPCLDENNHVLENEKDDDDGDTIDINANPQEAGGIGGMDTELISDEENTLTNDPIVLDKEETGENVAVAATAAKEDGKEKDKKRGRSRNKSFKKFNRNNRDRNYRDKGRDRGRSRSRSRSSRSRSRSNDKENRRRGRSKRREKRKEIPRYNVRNVVEERWQRRANKDRYGRDTSRQRSISPASFRRRSYSRSASRSRGASYESRSASRDRQRGGRQFSGNRRGGKSRAARSPIRRRSFGRRSSSYRKRSTSRRKSLSPLRGRNRSYERSRSLDRRSRSRIGSRSRSRSRSRSHTRSRSRSISRPRSIARTRSRSRSIRSESRRNLDRVASRVNDRTPSPERVKQKKRKKTAKGGRGKMKKKKNQKGHKRKAPVNDENSAGAKKAKKNISLSRSPSKSLVEEVDRAPSFSMSPPPGEENYGNEVVSWTPPLQRNAAPPAEEYISQTPPRDAATKSRKKEKKRSKQNKNRGDDWDRRQMRPDKQTTSKEVFASGDNILVSVSFNSGEANVQPQQTTIVTLPPTREGLLTTKKSRKTRTKMSGRKKKKIDSKPVAIIDLDKSPFKELTPSPKAVIILSDSEGGGNAEKDNDEGGTPRIIPSGREDVDSRTGSGIERRDEGSPPQSPITEADDSFNTPSMGPKTPPEPEHTIKFAVKPKNKPKATRTNILAEEEADDDQSEPEQVERHDSNENMSKIGPNTPPEPAPCSPDAYDPFEPTKSASQSRTPSPAPEKDDTAAQEKHEKPAQNQEIQETNETTPVKQHTTSAEKVLTPAELVMALMNSTSHANKSADSLNASGESQQSVRISASPQEKVEEATPAKQSSITIISNVLIQPSSKGPSTSTPVTTSSLSSSSLMLMPQIQTQSGEKSPARVQISSANSIKPSPMKASSSSFTKTSSNIMKLPLPKLTSGSQPGRHNGDQDVIEMDSPYSPASSDFDNLFDPPAEQSQKQSRNSSAQKVSPTKGANKAGPGDVFDNLFGSASPGVANNTGRSQQKTKTMKPTSGRSQMKRSANKAAPMPVDDSLRIDDVPGSAVELHVKDKYLRKLNRQERVVEEVKLVLKPHYNKKHITKDEYKDILRKAVPKICHSRTGEINPKKIQTLIEAYVKKFRIKRKMSGSQGTTSGTGTKTLKSLWA